MLPKRSKQCQAHRGAFQPGDTYVSLVTESEEGWTRADYCEKCWEDLDHQQGHFWKGKLPIKVTSEDEKALALLKRLENREMRYLLTLYLERKKMVVKRSERLFEIPKTGELLEVEPLLPSVGREKECLAELLGHFHESS